MRLSYFKWLLVLSLVFCGMAEAQDRESHSPRRRTARPSTEERRAHKREKLIQEIDTWIRERRRFPSQYSDGRERYLARWMVTNQLNQVSIRALLSPQAQRILAETEQGPERTNLPVTPERLQQLKKRQLRQAEQLAKRQEDVVRDVDSWILKYGNFPMAQGEGEEGFLARRMYYYRFTQESIRERLSPQARAILAERRAIDPNICPKNWANLRSRK